MNRGNIHIGAMTMERRSFLRSTLGAIAGAASGLLGKAAPAAPQFGIRPLGVGPDGLRYYECNGSSSALHAFPTLYQAGYFTSGQIEFARESMPELFEAPMPRRHARRPSWRGGGRTTARIRWRTTAHE